MPPDPAAQRRPPAARSGATRPFVLVLFGAALLFLVVVAVLVLGGRRVSAFRRSLELSQEWAVAERNLAGVGEALAALDAPVNDAFAGQGLVVASRRVADARSRVAGELIALRATVPGDSSAAAFIRVLAQVDTVAADAAAMDRAADSVLAELRAGHRHGAETLIAPLGRWYLSSLDHLRKARSVASQAQEGLVADQERSTRNANVIVRALALLVLLACAVAFDAGLDADRRMRSDAEERELALQRLAAAETDLRLAQEKLTHATEERFRRLVTYAPEGIYTLDPSGAITTANPALERLLALPAGSILGRNFREFVHPEDLPTSIEANRQRLLGNVPGNGAPVHRRVLRSDGAYFEAEVNTGPLFDPDGAVVGILGIMRDVSERRKVERALAQSEERYRTLVDYAPDPIYTLSLDGYVTSVNRACEVLTGHPASAMIGTHFSALLHPDDLARARDVNQETMQGATGTKGAIRILKADGSYVEVEVTSGPLGRSGTAGVLGILRDVTEVRRAAAEEAKLTALVRAAAQDWMLTFDTVNIGLVVLDASGTIHRLNEAARRLAGFPFSELIGRPLGWVGADDPWGPAAELAAATPEGAVGRSRVIDRGPERPAWSLTAVRYAAPDGERVILTIRDVSDSFQLQRSVQRAETMAALGVLVAGVAHEVRNPLFAISATLDAFEARFGADEAYRKWAAPLRPEVERLSQLMSDLLEYGRPPELQRVETDVGAVLTSASERTAALAASRRIRLSVQVAAGVPRTLADPGRLLQVFQNLFDNAVRHAPDGSVVEGVLDLRSEPDGPQLRCEVLDRGPGFDPADLQRVFEPFFSRRRGGTGLGLSIVQRLVEQHRGTITASNRDGGGGCVTVTIPVTRD